MCQTKGSRASNYVVHGRDPWPYTTLKGEYHSATQRLTKRLKSGRRLKVALCFDAVDDIVLSEELLTPLAFKYQRYFTVADALIWAAVTNMNRAEWNISDEK